jgi:hypothetical protein
MSSNADWCVGEVILIDGARYTVIACDPNNHKFWLKGPGDKDLVFVSWGFPEPAEE